MNPASPQPRASLLYNQGLIAKAAGKLHESREYFTASLALREHREVRAALNSLGNAGTSTRGDFGRRSPSRVLP
jgi:hypothetical protein